MSTMPVLQKAAYLIIVIIGGGWLIQVGSFIFMPLIFSFFFTILLSPVQTRFSKYIPIKWVTIILTLLTAIIPIVLIGYLFSIQLMDIINGLPEIGSEVVEGLEAVMSSINEYLPFFPANTEELMNNNLEKIPEGPINLIQKGLVSTSQVILGILLVFLFTFFMLSYRKNVLDFIVYSLRKSNQEAMRNTVEDIKATVKSYINGLGLVILILSAFNTIGLLVIGIKYALFWGCLAGILAIIPFIGTVMGGVLPLLYAIATTDTTWQPVAIVIYYVFIQQVEGNIITPKIVGDQVNLNPFVAILTLIFFGAYLGIGGIILSLPIVSILKIIMENFDQTKPIAVLLGPDIAHEDAIFKPGKKR